MGNRIVISESQYSRLFLNEQDYSSKRKVLYDNGVTGLKQNGVETKFIPSYEEISNTPHEKTITTLYNMAGYEMVKDIEWFKEGYLGGSNSMCRWVDLIGYGNSGSNIKGIKLKDLNIFILYFILIYSGLFVLRIHSFFIPLLQGSF